MGFSKDNLKGIILALSSSAFIGASFIIKKKGLRRAAIASGVRAGVGGFSYLLEPLWWLGMLTMIVGEVANFVAYAFAPAVLVTPLGALSIIISAVLAHFILNEKLQKLGILGCVMCIAGSIIIVIHAPQEHPITSVQEIWTMATQSAFLLYVASVIVLVFILAFHFSPQCGHSNVLVFTGICSLMGSLSALDTFNTAVVSPIYYVMFTSLTILASVIMFKDWDDQSMGSIVSEICGFVVVLSGTVLLQTTREFERSSSFRGGYAPLSPTLSTGLCSGNGEFLRHEEGDVPSIDEFCLQKQ
ncbi:probable magnesium transporter NIPA3 isoform X5 [Hevea brasiliensis]|uniref:probable magnesium transporter NIPA3 isoform X5 n=1 Tax=Hevea brasiliensis TaxID=3981 RepID=UPI0025F34956|nr:probable magnesium transporter NIPA3 isoform X5 [Hevea brasiliensis]